MKDIFIILKSIARFIYSLFKILPTQDKVVLISRKNTETSIDFKLLKDEILKTHPKYKVVILNHKITNKILHIFQIIIEMYHLSTSKACIIDSYVISISILNHKNNLIIIQIWHALGAIKKFGHAILDKPEGSSSKIAGLMNMHKNYTYIISGSKEMIPHFAKAFNVDESIIKPYSMPRVDYLLMNKNNKSIKKKIIDVYPELKNKKNILYSPTFRKNSGMKPEDLIKNINFEKYNLIITKHPLDSANIEQKDGVIIEDKFEFFDLLNVVDYLITDYSALAFEAAVLEIPMFFYVYDIDKYKNDRGLFINYKKEMPGVISKDAKEIINAIETKKYDLNKIKEFKKKYVSVLDKTSTKKIVKLMKLGEVDEK